MNKAEKSLRWVVNQIPDFKPTTNDEKMLVAIKLYSEAGAEEINRLEAENAELKARLEKAVELPYVEKCNEYTKIIYKNNYGDIEDETYFHDCFYGENKDIRGGTYAEARFTELKSGN